MNPTIQNYWRSQKGDWETYLSICREELANGGEDLVDILHHELMALYLLERYEEVISRYHEVKPLVQHDSRRQNLQGTLQTTLYRRGIELAEAGRSDEALAYFKESVQLDPECEMAHYCLGQHYQDRGDPYRALHHYYEALKIQPDFPEIYNNLAVIEFEEESDIKAAINHLETALTKDPSDELRLKIYMSLSRLNGLIADYDRKSFYLKKLMESLGFPVTFGEEGDEDDEE